MKKVLILTSAILLLAAACNKQAAVSPTPTPSPAPSNSLTYTNDQYGFTMTLQADWTGYSVLNQTWKGTDVATGKQTQSGPQIILRHPKWTAAAHYEDIPVMIFTPAQWNLVQSEKLSVSAAPIGPSKLDSNNKFVFALPARYNFDYATGYEEADQIAHTLKAFDPSVSTANWKTYSNTKYGFEFNYPTDHTVYSDLDLKNDKFIAAMPVSVKTVIADDEKLVFCCESTALTIQGTDKALVSPAGKKITFAGKTAYERGDKDCSIDKTYSITDVPLGSKYITITLACNTSLLNQILSTFKFTDSTSAANWKTYTNTKYGDSIQYPDVGQGPVSADPQSSSQGISLGSNANLLITAHDLNADFNNSTKYQKFTTKTINGIKVDQVQEFGTANDLFLVTLFTGKQYIYDVQFEDVHNSTNVDLFNQILTTFKFTK